jgi:hypothetical protein
MPEVSHFATESARHRSVQLGPSPQRRRRSGAATAHRAAAVDLRLTISSLRLCNADGIEWPPLRRDSGLTSSARNHAHDGTKKWLNSQLFFPALAAAFTTRAKHTVSTVIR